MARFLSKISSRVTTIRYWLRASGSSPQHEDGNSWFGDHSTRDMDFFDIGISDSDSAYLHACVSRKESRVG